MKQLNNRMRGFSLIELMVALVIGTLLILGVTNLLIGTKKNSKINAAAADLQDIMVYVDKELTYAIRNAGHNGGCLLSPQVKFRTSQRMKDLLFNFDFPVRGLNNEDNEYLSSLVGNRIEPIDGNSFLVIYGDNEKRYSLPKIKHPIDRVYFDKELEQSSNVLILSDTYACDLVVDLDRSDEIILNDYDYFLDNGQGFSFFPEEGYYQDSVQVLDYNASLYYVSMQDNIPSLIKTPVSTYVRDGSADYGMRLIAEGAVDINFSYGLDTNKDKEVDTYKTSIEMSASDWASVVSVRYSVLLIGLDKNVLDSNAVFDYITTNRTLKNSQLADWVEFTQGQAIIKHKRLARILTSEIAVRNRLP